MLRAAPTVGNLIERPPANLLGAKKSFWLVRGKLCLISLRSSKLSRTELPFGCTGHYLRASRVRARVSVGESGLGFGPIIDRHQWLGHERSTKLYRLTERVSKVY
jgi:hypothetical protein